MPKLKLPDKGIITGIVETELGWLSFAVSHKGLKFVKFMYDDSDSAKKEIMENINKSDLTENDKLVKKWSKELTAYFDGSIEFDKDIPLDTDGWSEFQKKVYRTVQSIPYGKTASYGAIAGFLGNEKASRAVGNALKNNPVPPIVPCHRVIASDKDIGGFSAKGGIELKTRLLEIEKKFSR